MCTHMSWYICIYLESDSKNNFLSTIYRPHEREEPARGYQNIIPRCTRDIARVQV